MPGKYLDPDMDDEQQSENLDMENAICTEASAFEMCLDIATDDFAQWLVGEIERPIDYPAHLTRWVAKVKKTEIGLFIRASWLDFWGTLGLEPDEVSSLHEEHPDYVFGARFAGPGRTVFWGKCCCMAYEKPGDGRYWNIAAKAFRLFGRTTSSIARCPTPLQMVLDGKAEAHTDGVNPSSLVCYLDEYSTMWHEDTSRVPTQQEEKGPAQASDTHDNPPGPPTARHWETISLAVPTSAEHLASWLNEVIRGIPQRQFINEYDVPYRLRFEWWTKPLLAGALEGHALVVFMQPIRPDNVDPKACPDLPEKAPAWLEILPQSSDRAQVVARYDEFIIGQYIRGLLETIRCHYPVTAPPIGPRPEPNPPEPTAVGSVASAPVSNDDPLLRVPEGAAREFLRLWRAGEESARIAKRFGMKSIKKVGDRASELRRTFGEEVVPYRQNRGHWEDDSSN
jgi:hypothetical protein